MPSDPATVTFLCPSCSEELCAVGSKPTCEGCRAVVHLKADGAQPSGGEVLDRCVVCAAEAMYIAKDFNKNLGLAIVALGCIGFYWGPMVGVGTLVALTILDRVVYHLRPVVTVCYACKAVYRGVPLNPTHKGYELTYDESFEGTGTPPEYVKEA